MAIIKHIASKNADYGAAEKYLIYQHDERTNKPILDENGNMIPRETYLIDGVNCTPEMFAIECVQLNKNCNKNLTKNEIKSHHYILSFDPKDSIDNGLTAQKAQNLGLEFCKKNFPGHQAIVCTHTDGHNESGNIHVHIVINSLRLLDVEKKPFMKRDSDCLAGHKHHVTKSFLTYLKQDVMDMCHRENLYQVDLLAPAKVKITDREYRKTQPMQKTISSQGFNMPSKFATTKEQLRTAITNSMTHSYSIEEFRNHLLQHYGIILKESRGRFSYLLPDRTKPISGRSLGSDFENDFITNFLSFHRQKKMHSRNTLKPNLYISTNLIVDLQTCVKAQQNIYYAQKVKNENLKKLAKTIADLQDTGIHSITELHAHIMEAQEELLSVRNTLKAVETELKKTNKLIHYTGQYLANKKFYVAYQKSNLNPNYALKYQAELTLFESAKNTLSSMEKNGTLPDLNVLKTKKEKLQTEKSNLQKRYSSLHAELHNLDAMQKKINVLLNSSSTYSKSNSLEQS